MGTIVAAVVISYLSYPLYRWMLRYLRKKSLTALLTVIILVVVITIPTIFLLNTLSKEIFAGYLFTKQFVAGSASSIDCSENPLCFIFNFFGLDQVTITNFLNDTLGRFTASVFSAITGYVLQLPKIIANIFVMLFLTYYLLKDGPALIDRVKALLPITKSDQETLIRRFNNVTFAVVYGNVIVAVIQGLLTSLGFFIFGVPSPLIWGIVTMFFSLLPSIGAFIVWLPGSLYLLIVGYSEGSGFVILKGIGLFLYGTFIISGIDNVLKPRIIGNRANLHPALVLLGVIGGLAVLGVPGIVLGPVLIALAVTVIDMTARKP